MNTSSTSRPEDATSGAADRPAAAPDAAAGLDGGAQVPADGGSAPAVPVLRLPSDGVPEVTADAEGLAHAAGRLAAGVGPVAIDAERASGHRYGQRAFLFQLRREGAGTWLIDPAALGDLTPLADALVGTEWILHASTQDLPCLAERGLRPERLFDTELAGRLLGLPRVGLAPLTEELLGVGLAKGHGAADWSRRPLPHEWLAYAALDVELLHALRQVLADRLEQAGRTEWARQEFDYLTRWRPRPRVDPWRRTSGIGSVRDPRGLAIVRSLWEAREQAAERADRPPGRVLADAAIIAAAKARPTSQDQLRGLPAFARLRRRGGAWWEAIRQAQDLPESDLPPRHAESGPPPARSWERRDPVAAARLAAVRQAIGARADELGLPAEVLISPELVRALVWESEGPVSEDEVRQRLTPARAWQLDQVAGLVCAALADGATA